MTVAANLLPHKNSLRAADEASSMTTSDAKIDHVEAYICRISDELLTAIFRMLEDTDSGHCGKPWTPLLLVNWRFLNIATPLMYRFPKTERTGVSMEQPITGFKLLYRTFKENPSLRQHCQQFRIEFVDLGRNYKFKEDPFDLMTNFIVMLPNLRHLALEGDFRFLGKKIGRLVEAAIPSLPLLTTLFLGTKANSLLLTEIIPYLKHASTIKELELHNVSDGVIRQIDWVRKVGLVSPEQRRTGPFTTLRLCGYNDDYIGTVQLLSWPKALRQFELTRMRRWDDGMTLAMLSDALEIHKNTLETLKVTYLTPIDRNDRNGGSMDEEMLDVSQYPVLKELSLSRWSFSCEKLVFSDEVGAKILAPQLKKFTWDFTLEEGWMKDCRETWWDMGLREVEWLRRLGCLAADGRSSLRTIHVEFNPACVKASKNSVYPWDLLDSVSAELLSRGISLTYSTPLIGRESWQRRVDRGTQNATDEDERNTESDMSTDQTYGVVQYLSDTSTDETLHNIRRWRESLLAWLSDF